MSYKGPLILFNIVAVGTIVFGYTAFGGLVATGFSFTTAVAVFMVVIGMFPLISALFHKSLFYRR